MHCSAICPICIKKGADVTVDPDGGVAKDPNEGWTFDGSRYTNAFSVGTTLKEIMDDLGALEEPDHVIISVTSSEDVLTEAGMTVTVGWINYVNILLVIIALIIVSLLAYKLYKRERRD